MATVFPIIVDKLMINGISLPPEGFEAFATPIGAELQIHLEYHSDFPPGWLRFQIADPFPEQDAPEQSVLAHPIGPAFLSASKSFAGIHYTPISTERFLLLLLYEGHPVYRLVVPLKAAEPQQES